MALDPKNVEALIGMAGVHTVVGYLIMTDDRAAHLESAEAFLTKALSINPHHALAHSTLGAVQIALGRTSQGIAECQRALELDHNLATAHALIGLAKHHLGCSAETEAHVSEALRLSPRDSFLPWWMHWVGLSKLALNACAEAAVCFRRSIEANRTYYWAYFWLAATLVRLGSLDEAKIALQQGLALDPNLTLRRLRSNTPASREQLERFLEGLRLAGMPEG